MFLQVFVSLTVMLVATSATIFYVLPDDSTTDSCPSQPCATLSQYLLDNNGTLPVVSDVEYHFLPGEYQPDNVFIQHANNFVLTGTTKNGSPLTVWVSSCYQSFYPLVVSHSHNVKIANMVFKRCEVSNNATYLYLACCTSASLNNIAFINCGFYACNLFGRSFIIHTSFKLYNPFHFSELHGVITIRHEDDVCTTARTDNKVEITNSLITNISFGGVFFALEQEKYNFSAVLYNLKFQNIPKTAIKIFAVTSVAVDALIENCTFTLNEFICSEFHSMIMIVIGGFS